VPLTFDTVFNRLMGVEGGYSNDPKDPGGETNWGISKRAYPDVDIKGLTRDGAKAIYLRDFWNRIEADTLPTSVAYQVFDFGVNSGIETAVRYLQRALGVADDGNYGPVSRAAAAAIAEPDLIMRLLAERLEFMTRLAAWDHDGRGWARRIAADLRYGAVDA
jgi:lysozyme family protein